MRRIEIWLLVVAVLVAAVWGLAWWLITAYVEREVDEALAASAEGDVAVACEERERRGFPFRLEIVCTGATARAADGTWSARIARFRAGALVHRPREIEAILDGPAEIAAAALDGPVTADWAAARVNVFIGDAGPRQLLVRLFSSMAELAGTRIAAHQGRLSVDPDGAGGSLLAAAGEQLRIAAGDQALPPFDFAAEARTPIPPEQLLSGEFEPEAGLRIDDLSLSLETTQLQAYADGALEVDPEGWASGSLTLHLVGIENLPAIVEGLPGEVAGGANVAVGALMALGSPADWRGRPARRIALTIEEGTVRAGPLALGRLPPLWRALPGL